MITTAKMGYIYIYIYVYIYFKFNNLFYKNKYYQDKRYDKIGNKYYFNG
ncbi:MAG: hypothetical protein N7Q72_06225 [Spiroplasma sp. Tabriz.8]|nr:hypothetical protein [Spiroplasma sp. Tabriz.8]